MTARIRWPMESTGIWLGPSNNVTAIAAAATFEPVFVAGRCSCPAPAPTRSGVVIFSARFDKTDSGCQEQHKKRIGGSRSSTSD
jgi:hypothetical protein